MTIIPNTTKQDPWVLEKVKSYRNLLKHFVGHEPPEERDNCLICKRVLHSTWIIDGGKYTFDFIDPLIKEKKRK